MAQLSPIISQSPSKENDSIGGQPAAAAASSSHDEFEDSLNVSISEHISEEIESSAAEDSIDKPAQRFDQLISDKKRKLFDFDDDSEKSEVIAVGAEGVTSFSKFDINNGNLDEILSGDNIAKHFKVDVEKPQSESPSHHTSSKEATKDESDKIAISSKKSSELHKIDKSTKEPTESRQNSSPHSSKRGSIEHGDDVILINDQEISIHSLEELQKQKSRTDDEHSKTDRTNNQNTTSDISDLLIEGTPKEQKSIDDISAISINEDENSSKHNTPSKSKSESEKVENRESQSEKSQSESTSPENEPIEVDEHVQKCKPMEPLELSIIEELSADEKLSSHINNNKDGEKELIVNLVLDDVIDSLPLNKENRPPNFRDEFLLPMESKHATSSQNSTATDGTVVKAGYPEEADLGSEININLIHMQNKIKELQNINAGKYTVGAFDLQTSNSSRRDSLKDFPQSGRESMSITTNSTEYRTFQEEYFQLTNLQVALCERDKIIQELTESLKQSIEIRDQLNERNERLLNETKQLRAATPSNPKKWSETPEQRIDETTIDLVSESEFEDEECQKKVALVQEKPIAQVELQQPVQTPNAAIEAFKKDLTNDEVVIFTRIQDKFEQKLNDDVNELKQKLYQEQLEKTEQDAEINRLQQLLRNIKGGSTEVVELRTELDKVHKKEMENLRMYFERKCTDLEKQYSEEVFSQHSRRHSNDTNSDLSDDEIFLPDDGLGSRRRASKTGEILASPTHRKITPTNIRSAGSSPAKRSLRDSDSKSLDSEKMRNLSFDQLHEYYQRKIVELRRLHESEIKQLQYKLQPDDEYLLTKASPSTENVLLTEEKLKNNIEYNEMFNNLVIEYDRRLEEQVKLAKQDMLNELEVQIKTLLSESIPEESRWPPELILLREKFTAKSQLEIAQLQIKHEEEMSRLKLDHQKQLNRKLKRQTDFDHGRDLEKWESERDNLRELCHTFHQLLYELAKCVSVCENDLNTSLVEELNKYGIIRAANAPLSPGGVDDELNQSVCSTVGNTSMRLTFVPDVSGILSLIEDPSLLNFVNEKCENEDSMASNEQFDLNDCLERLKIEADSLLHMSEKLIQKSAGDSRGFEQQNNSIEEEDGLKCAKMSSLPISSKDELNMETRNQKQRLSLPLCLPTDKPFDINQKVLSHGDINDLKNRLIIAENRNKELEKKLAESIALQNELNVKLNSYLDGHSEELSEGYGISQLRSPQRQPNKSETSFSALQERAKQYFNDTNVTENVSQLLQLIEDFCREGDKLIEEEKDVKKGLQNEIEAAYNQRKQDLEFWDKQAAEREAERDEFIKEIEKLESKIEKLDKERLKFDNITKESESLRQQVQEMESSVDTYQASNARLTNDLKESISKIYDLREIIVELEKQIKEKDNKLRSLEHDMDYQKTANESLQYEMESLITQTETTPVYEEKINQLEEQLRSLQPNSDQSAAIERIACHLREIEDNLDRKTNLLESIHLMTGSVTACSSPSEDVSVRGSGNNLDGAILSPRNFKYLAKDPSFPVDQISRIMEKMQKHSKVEEAAIKLVRDLEMQIKALHTSYVELQSERDLLKEKMDEQILRITSIQSRLDEQRQRAEELQRAGTSDLNLKVYDLQTELAALKETVSARDKQIAVLKNHLTQSKEIIDKQEAEIAAYSTGSGGSSGEPSSKGLIDKLEAQIAARELENKSLRDKIRNEMITKVALPDLMETVLADKTDEIDKLKDQLEARDKELKALRDRNIFFAAEEKLNLLFAKGDADYLDNDHIRKMAEVSSGLSTNVTLDPIKMIGMNEQSMEPPMPHAEDTPPLKPRQIHFTSKSTVEATKSPFTTSEILRAFESQSDGTTVHDETDNNQTALQHALETKSKLVDELKAENEKLKETLNAEKQKLSKEIESLKNEVDNLKKRVERTEEELAMTTELYDKKCNEFDSVNNQLTEEQVNNGVIKQQLGSMKNTIQLKDELITKLEKDLFNYAQNENKHLETIQRLQKENQNLVEESKEAGDRSPNQKLQLEHERLKQMLAAVEHELAEKMIAYEKCLLDLAEHEKTIYHLNDVLTDSKTARSVEELRIEIRNYHDANEDLKNEVDQLRQQLLLTTNRSPSPIIEEIDENAIEEITNRVEQELHYSAQLDTNIMKAIESDEINSDNENDFDRVEINKIQAQNKALETKIEELKLKEESERQKFASIREQDAKCIETMTKRLEAALDQENILTNMLDEERKKTAQLSTKILEHQFERSKLSTSSLSLNDSPAASPRRQKSTDMDQECAKRQNDEIKLLKSQLEREKERAVDVEKSLTREKERFDKELRDHKSYGDSIKDELDRIIRENVNVRNELDDAQERLAASSREIDNLQSRIKNLQETDSYRAARQEKERNELAQNIAASRELKNKLTQAERERDVLKERVSILQTDIDRGAEREAKLMDKLANVAGYSLQNQQQNAPMPHQLLVKLKEMNDNLSENVRENRQLSETLQFLTEERQVLQKKLVDLEQMCVDRDEMEERANHLFGKYLRTESFRRALIHQKRYLMIVLSTYETNESKVLSALNGTALMPKRRKLPSFKSVVLVAIAVERMKFILRRWHTGKRVCAKNTIFAHSTGPRRSHSAAAISWTRSETQVPNILYQPQSPPSRDRDRPATSVLKGRRCQLNDFTNKI